MNNQITWNGKSFWHGTSTIFLGSIHQTGLGTINPGTDLKLLEVLEYLYLQVQKFNISAPVLDIHRETIEATIAQTDLYCNNGLKFNFRHEGIYISASQQRAVIYACLNKTGSEILDKCLILLSILIAEGRNPIIPPDIDLFNIKLYLSTPAKPILIEITEVDDDNLVLENGENASEKLKELRSLLHTYPISYQFEHLQFCNFRLLKPVPVNNLRFYELDFEGHPKDVNFAYYLTKT